jgi:hypothetical protein
MANSLDSANYRDGLRKISGDLPEGLIRSLPDEQRAASRLVAREVCSEAPPIRLVDAVEVSAESPLPAVEAADTANYQPKSWPVKAWRLFKKVATWIFGLVSLLGCLAALSAIPLLQFVSLGYLLEASGRVARSGRLRDGFIDFSKFARIGSLVLGTWLMLLPLRLLADLSRSAYLIDPTGPSARGSRLALIACTILTVGHVLLAWYSGGKLRHFFWPLLAPFQLAAHLVLGRLLRPLLKSAVAAIWPALADDLFALRPLSGQLLGRGCDAAVCMPRLAMRFGIS